MVSVIHMSSPFIWKRYPSLFLFKEIHKGMYFMSNYDNTNGEWCKLILSHLKINWSPFPTFSFLCDSWIKFFDNSREFLSQWKKFQILSYPKMPVSVNLLYMFLCFSESSISCWKETIEEKTFVRELCKLYLVQEENTLNLLYNSALWFEGLQDFPAANF